VGVAVLSVLAMLGAEIAVVTAPAAAARRPSQTERHAILRVLGRRSACVQIEISTARRGWAAARYRSSPGASCTSPSRIQESTPVLHRGSAGRWHLVVAECNPEVVPLSVQRDLGLVECT
jgi:hypothetical protein